MLDPRLLRTDLENVAAGLARRYVDLDVTLISDLETRRKELQVAAEQLQSERNSRSKQIGKAKAAGEDIQPLLAEVSDLGERLKAAQDQLGEVQRKLSEIAMGTPNIPHSSVPEGRDEEDNREERRWGEPPRFDFEPKDHVDLGAANGGMNFEVAAKITGSRFANLQGPLARLHRVLAQFMLNVHTAEHGYTETYVPLWSMPTACVVPGSYRNSRRICSKSPAKWPTT